MPADLADAEPGTVYYGEMTYRERGAETKVFGPTRYVRRDRPIQTRRVRIL